MEVYILIAWIALSILLCVVSFIKWRRMKAEHPFLNKRIGIQVKELLPVVDKVDMFGHRLFVINGKTKTLQGISNSDHAYQHLDGSVDHKLRAREMILSSNTELLERDYIIQSYTEYKVWKEYDAYCGVMAISLAIFCISITVIIHLILQNLQ